MSTAIPPMETPLRGFLREFAQDRVAVVAFVVLALIVMGIVAFTLLDRGYDLTHSNLTEWNRSNTPLRLPLAVPQIPWLFGLALFLFSIIVALLRTLSALARGDMTTARETAGVAAQDEEIEGELATLGIAFGQQNAKSEPGRPAGGR